jgi:hypothetical protein
MKEERDEAIAEFYLRLLPYMLRDFIHKEDLKIALEEVIDDPSLIDSIFMATQRLASMRTRYDNGEPITKIVTPIMEID